MGASVRYFNIKGRDFDSAWKKAVEQDVYDRGNEPYNGGISHIHSFNEVKEKKDFNEAVLPMQKYSAYYRCITPPIKNTNKIKTDVIRYPNKGSRKWETVYIAIPKYVRDNDVAIVSIMERTLGEAITKARAWVEKNPEVKLSVKIGKKLIGAKEEDLCADISYKKSSTERDGVWEVMAVVPE